MVMSSSAFSNSERKYASLRRRRRKALQTTKSVANSAPRRRSIPVCICAHCTAPRAIKKTPLPSDGGGEHGEQRAAELLERRFLQLTDAFAAQVVLLADLLERQFLVVGEPEPQEQDV